MLLDPQPGAYGNAYAVSADGSVIVGDGFSPFCWDSVHGLRNLSLLLSRAGVDIGPRSLTSAQDISEDGKTIVGFGYEPRTNRSFAWRIVLDGPNCPADLTGDQLVDFQDYLLFINLYDAQDMGADFNHDTFIDFNDYLAFLNDYERPC